MKIIKKGKPKKQEYIMGCRFCKTIFTYTSEDTFFDDDIEERIKCPICEAWLYVPFFKKKYKGSDK